MSDAYKKAGVDIDAGNEAVNRMKQHVQKTFREEVKTGLGGFGSLFALKEYKHPILVSGTDGVGTKLKLAFEMNIHDTIGIDLVAMCVNDILVQGAEPLFFLDYIATGKLYPEQVEDIVKGIADGCQQANCSLVGGETAEMPSMYTNGEYDVAGFAVGVVEEEKLIDGSIIQEEDVVIGLASNGIHSNGYSLVRHLLFEQHNYKLSDFIPEIGGTLGEVLIKPTRIYVKPILEMLKQINIKGMAHITGGGLLENIPRILPKGLQVDIDLSSWDRPPIFDFLQKLGELKEEELYRTFNMGIGYVLVIGKNEQEHIVELANKLGEQAFVIGRVNKGDQGVVLGR